MGAGTDRQEAVHVVLKVREKMFVLYIQFLIFVYSCGVYHVQASTEQCGECSCIHIEPNIILDCENLGLTSIPDMGNIIQRKIIRAYMAGNDIKEVRTTDLAKWYSLQYIDFSENPNFDCSELEKVPSHVKIEVECIHSVEGKYLSL